MDAPLYVTEADFTVEQHQELMRTGSVVINGVAYSPWRFDSGGVQWLRAMHAGDVNWPNLNIRYGKKVRGVKSQTMPGRNGVDAALGPMPPLSALDKGVLSPPSIEADGDSYAAPNPFEEFRDLLRQRAEEGDPIEPPDLSEYDGDDAEDWT